MRMRHTGWGLLLVGTLAIAGVWAAGPAEPPAIAAAESAHVTGRVAMRAIVARPGDRTEAVVAEALADFARVDDVVRMVLEPPELAAYREEDHVEVVFEPARAVAIAPQGATVRLSRLLVPLAAERSQPDWFFYALSEGGKTWGVYRWRGADAGRVAALRQAVRQLSD